MFLTNDYTDLTYQVQQSVLIFDGLFQILSQVLVIATVLSDYYVENILLDICQVVYINYHLPEGKFLQRLTSLSKWDN